MGLKIIRNYKTIYKNKVLLFIKSNTFYYMWFGNRR